MSISDAGGLVVSASGTASGQTTGGTANHHRLPVCTAKQHLACRSRLASCLYFHAQHLYVHKVLGTDADIAQLNDDVNDFFARYRIGSTNPTTDLDAGDLFLRPLARCWCMTPLILNGKVQAVGNYSSTS